MNEHVLKYFSVTSYEIVAQIVLTSHSIRKSLRRIVSEYPFLHR